jgi:hypothetical protein
LIHLSGETLVSRTTSFQRFGTAGLAALAMVGLLAGCSSKKNASSSTGSIGSATAAADTSAGGPAAASPTASLPSPSKVVATGGGKFCQQVAAEVNNSVAQEAASGNADAVTSIKQSVQQFQSVEGSILKSAPNAIKPDLVTLFGAIDQFYGALAKANYDFTKIDPSVEAPLEAPAVQKAEQNIDAYLKNTCGIDTGAGDNSSAQAQASAAEASALALLSAAAAPSS